MNQTTIDNIINQLWPAGTPIDARRVFAILDGARDEKIEPMVRASKLPHDCLYYEPLTEKLRAAAPYLVELKPNAGFTIKLLESGWGKSWGIFLITYPPSSLRAVSHSYRKINIVEDPSGNKLFFRYYDPRVLRIYLPTCHLDEVQAVFGPVKEIMMEGEEANQLQCFKHSERSNKTELYKV